MPDPTITFCTNCGSHLAADAHFCGICGHAREADDTTAASNAVPAAAGAVTMAAVATLPTVAAAATIPTPAAAAGPAAFVAAPSGPSPTGPPPGGPAPGAPYVARAGPPLTPAPHRGVHPMLIVAGIVSALVLLVSVGVIVWTLRPDAGTPSPTTVPYVASTTSAAPTTSTTTTTAPPTTPVPTTAAPTTQPPPTAPPTAPPTSGIQTGDAAGTAINVVANAVSNCGQGGLLGQYSAVEIRAGVYRVTVPVTFEGSSDWGNASWQVDFNSGNPQVVPEDPTAAALICTAP